MDLQGVCAVESVKDLTFFHTKLKSPVPVYGRTGLVTSILCHLIGPICCFKVMENNFVWGRLFTWLKMAKNWLHVSAITAPKGIPSLVNIPGPGRMVEQGL